MRPSSNADKPRRKKKELSTSEISSPLSRESETGSSNSYRTVGNTQPSPQQARTTGSPTQFESTQTHHEHLGRSYQQPVSYTTPAASEYAVAYQPLGTHNTPRRYMMYGDTTAPQHVEATSAAAPEHQAHQEPHWYDSNGVLYISTDRGVMPAVNPTASSSSAVPANYSRTNFVNPNALPPSPTGPNTMGSSDVASSAMNHGAMIPGTMTPAATTIGSATSGSLTASSVEPSTIGGDPLTTSPTPLGSGSLNSAAPIEPNTGRPYYDADPYNQTMLTGSTPPGIISPGMGPTGSYTPNLSVSHSDLSGSAYGNTQFREHTYQAAAHARSFPAPAFHQIYPQMPPWKPASYAYGYYPYMPVPLYEQQAFRPVEGNLTPGQLVAGSTDGLENRDSGLEATHMLAGGEKNFSDKLSSIDTTSPLEGMGQMITDTQGIPWLKFEYSRDRVQCSYQIRCDIENINEDLFSEGFREKNCIYPRAMVPPEEYKGHRQQYETVCNQIGWRLAFRNPVLQNSRGLIQRAVDTYRNSSRDVSTRSRRARRILKQQEKERQRRLQQQEQHQQQQQPHKRRPRNYWPG